MMSTNESPAPPALPEIDYQLVRLDLESVKIIRLHRQPNSKIVRQIAKSLGYVGLLEPIIVNSKYELIAGRQRLESARLAGETQIWAIIRDFNAEKTEIAALISNLARQPLTRLERCEQIRQLKILYEQANPQARRRTNRHKKSKDNASPSPEIYPPVPTEITSIVGHYHDSSATLGGKSATKDKATFAKVQAKESGTSANSVRRQIRIADNLTPLTKELIANHSDAEQLTKLEWLARREPDEQEAIAGLAATDSVSFEQAARTIGGESQNQSAAPPSDSDPEALDSPAISAAVVESAAEKTETLEFIDKKLPVALLVEKFCWMGREFTELSKVLGDAGWLLLQQNKKQLPFKAQELKNIAWRLDSGKSKSKTTAALNDGIERAARTPKRRQEDTATSNQFNAQRSLFDSVTSRAESEL